MSCLGVLFAVPEDVVRKLGDMLLEERPEYISEELEEEYFEEYPERTYELDKSWDAMHRLLTDGTLSFGGEEPLAKLCLAVRYFISMKITMTTSLQLKLPMKSEKYMKLCRVLKTVRSGADTLLSLPMSTKTRAKKTTSIRWNICRIVLVFGDMRQNMVCGCFLQPTNKKRKLHK